MGRLSAATIALALFAAAPAYADETITAVPPDNFGSAVTTIDQGEKVTFQNLDISGHDVTSKQGGLFGSGLVDPGQSAPVLGVEYLTTGDYGFVCTIHPGMEAMLRVTSAGTPAPRPNVTVKINSKKLDTVREQRKLKLTLSTTAPMSVNVAAKFGQQSLGATTVEHEGNGDQAVTLRLNKAGRKALKGKKTAKITVTAKGAGGETKATRTLR